MIVRNQIIDSHVYYIHYNVMTIDKYYLCKNICPSCWQHSSLILRTFLHTSLVFWSRLYLLYFLSVGEVTLFLQRWCGWNSSLEAILDVPETWKATTRNHSLLQRKNTTTQLFIGHQIELSFSSAKMHLLFDLSTKIQVGHGDWKRERSIPLQAGRHLGILPPSQVSWIISSQMEV